MDDIYTPEAIAAAAREAGITLDPAWRDDLIAASRAVIDNKRRVRPPRDMAAEPAHVFAAGRQG